MSEDVVEAEEPLWRARARIAAMVFLVLALLVDLSGATPSPAVLLGSIVAVIALFLRLPFGVAVLFVDAALELVDVLVSYREHGALAAIGHAVFALGVAAIGWVLYRRSDDERFERRWTIAGALAMPLGLTTSIVTVLVAIALDPEDELGTISVLHGDALPSAVSLPGEGWRARRASTREPLGLDAWAVRYDPAGELRDEIFIALRMGVPSGSEGLDLMTNDPFDGAESREFVEDDAGRWIHARYATALGAEWSSCRVEIVHGAGTRVCAVVHGDTTAEHLSELTDAISAMRWDP